MTEKFIETQNGRIYYWIEIVSKDNPTVIFLHGLSSNHKTWDETLEQYKSAGYNTITVDMRGHGLSDKRRKRNLYKIGVMKNDVVEIIKKEGLNKVSVLGYSYGGYVGIDLAINNPELVSKLVLISSNHASPFIYHWYGFVSPLVYLLVNLAGWLLWWQKRNKYHYFNPKTAIGYWRTTFSGLSTMPLSINFWMLAEVFRMDYRDDIYWIKCPTLVVTGEGDTFITAREIGDMHKKISESKVVTIGAGHYVASHYQMDTASEVIKFLKESKI